MWSPFMLIFEKPVKVIKGLVARILNKIDNLADVFQGLLLIAIIDEFCYVKLTNKRDLIRSILTKRL
jgi:hypothetical protein